jgi:hypothetical protein
MLPSGFDRARVMSREPALNILGLTNIDTRVHQALDGINVEHRFSSTGRSQPRVDSGKSIWMIAESGSLGRIFLQTGTFC